MCDYIYEELFRFIRKEDIENVKQILTSRLDVDISKTDHKGKGTTLIHYSTTGEICKELVLHGACVNARDIEGQTPLHHAIFYRRGLSVVRELVRHGADVNACDNYQQTPLIAAARLYGKDLLNVIRELLQNGANPNAHDYQGISALTIAVYAKHLELIIELLEFGADINFQSQSHFILFSTPLAAAVNGSEDCAKLLIKHTLIKNFDSDYKKKINLECYSKLTNYSKLSCYLEECVCEIVQMKSQRINFNCILHDFVTKAGKHIRPLYFSNEEIRALSTNYPIYNDIILSNIEPYLERGRLMDKLRTIHFCVETNSTTPNDVRNRNICINADCLFQIADYLTNDEIFKFVEAFDKFDQPSFSTESVLNSCKQTDIDYDPEVSKVCAKRCRTSH